MKTYTALIVKKLSTRLGQFSVDTFAFFTGHLEVVREIWVDLSLVPRQVRAIRMSGGELEPTR